MKKMYNYYRIMCIYFFFIISFGCFRYNAIPAEVVDFRIEQIDDESTIQDVFCATEESIKKFKDSPQDFYTVRLIFNVRNNCFLSCINWKVRIKNYDDSCEFFIMKNEVVCGGIYCHFKGNIYELNCVAKDSETLEILVVYTDICDENKIWVRPASMWREEVLYNGESVKRFEYIAPDIDRFDEEKHLKIIEDILQIFDEYDRVGDNNSLSYYDKESESVITIPLGAFAVAEGDRDETEIEEYERKCIPQAISVCEVKDRYIRILGDGLLDEYQLMLNFTAFVPWKYQPQLEKALQGKDAFRRFKDTAVRLELIEDWYSYKDMRNRKEIRQWCDIVGIDWKKSYFK